jgi:hypothetical protein
VLLRPLGAAEVVLRALLDRDAIGDSVQARQLLDRVVTIANELGMHRLALQAHAHLDTN